MKEKTISEYRLNKIGVAALAILVILAAFASYYAGVTIGAPTVTIAQTTHTEVSITTSTLVSTSSVFQTVTVTSTSLLTATYIGPDSVTITGIAKSRGTGTTANQIIFTQPNSSNTIDTHVQGGQYSVTLTNHENYIVTIGYSGAVGGFPGGSCTAGGLVLFTGDSSIQADWSC